MINKLSKFLIFLFLPAYCFASAKVVTSISPIASIVAMLLDEQIEVISLANSNGCPHHHTVKLSDLSDIKTADINIYIDKDFDYFAAKLMNINARKIIKLSDFQELKIIFNNGKPNWHLWLDLGNVEILLKKLSILFIDQFPESKQSIIKRLENSLIKISDLSRIKDNTLSDLSQILLFSDSLEYFFAYNNNVIKSDYSSNKNLNYINQFQYILNENPFLKCLVFSTDQDTKFYNKYNKKIIQLESENWHSSKDLSNLYFTQYVKMIQLVKRCQ
ncbi:MAG: metal ABC transporter solute-binding protein, Zn/Mn family [Janthinobacterium lividum]